MEQSEKKMKPLTVYLIHAACAVAGITFGTIFADNMPLVITVGLIPLLGAFGYLAYTRHKHKAARNELILSQQD